MLFGGCNCLFRPPIISALFLLLSIISCQFVFYSTTHCTVQVLANTTTVDLHKITCIQQSPRTTSTRFSSFHHHQTMSVPYRQDMPPPGGFEHVKYKRNLPARGPGAYAILGGVTAICAYGFYRLGKGNLEKRELEREKLWSRIHLVPLLMAEGDRDLYRRQQAALSREKEIMKNVPGWEAGKSVYNNPKYAQESVVLV